MANYFNLTYESSAASSPGNVELNYGAPTSNGLTVHVSLYAGDGFTPTHYKMWGVELVQGEGVVTISGAEWLPYTETRTVRLARHNDPQYASVKFKNASETETDTFTSNSVTFTFVEPRTHSSAQWETDFEELGFDSAPGNVLRNTNYGTRVELNKNKLDQLAFNGRDFSGLRMEPNTIYINPSSEIGQLIGLDAESYVTISKVFSSTDVPIITVDYGDGFSSLSTYDQEVRTTVSGNNAGRISNIVWNAGTKTLTFDAYKFSTYGFAIIQKVEFTADSQTGVYIGDTGVIKVYIQDTNGEPVENAPVTISGVGDSIGTFQESMPLETDENGIAEFNLDVTSAGAITFEANVDDVYFTDPDLLVNGITPVSRQRSLLTQYEQIYKTAVYSDEVADVNTQAVAEPTTPTVSGSSDSVLEHDLNVLRTLMKQLKGTTNWFDSVPKYFDPEDTDAGDAENADATISNIAGNTLDAKTIIMAVSDSNSGSGFSVNSGDEGFLFSTTLAYAKPANRVGLPIFQSTTNSGTYHDEGGLDRVVGIDLINTETGAEFRDSSDNIVFAKFHDGADHSGTGEGTDVYVKFYTDDGPYTTVSGDPSSLLMVYPYRKVMSDVAEYEWNRTDFISSWEGDESIVDDIANLWSYTGASNDATDPSWVTVSGSPLVTASDTSLVDAVNSVNDGFGSRTFLEDNYLTDGQSITDSLDALDVSMYALSQTVADGVAEKYVQVVVSDIPAGTAHQLPVGVTYTPAATGSNMDVYLDGQLLAASTGTAGANADRDYAETSPTHITFHFDVYQYSNIVYKVRN